VTLGTRERTKIPRVKWLGGEKGVSKTNMSKRKRLALKGHKPDLEDERLSEQGVQMEGRRGPAALESGPVFPLKKNLSEERDRRF